MAFAHWPRRSGSQSGGSALLAHAASARAVRSIAAALQGAGGRSGGQARQSPTPRRCHDRARGWKLLRPHAARKGAGWRHV